MSKHSYQQRKNRVRAKVKAVGRPRLSVFRSNKYIYAQIIDEKGKTLVSLSSKDLSQKLKETAKSKTQEAAVLGEEIAAASKKKKVSKVVFDRGAYKYHGRVKALAEGARKGGLSF
jgi:large subunit ribosomal protein L18